MNIWSFLAVAFGLMIFSRVAVDVYFKFIVLDATKRAMLNEIKKWIKGPRGEKSND